MDAMNMIGRRPLIDDLMHTPTVRVPTKQSRDTDEKWGIAIPQCQEHGPHSPQEVSSILTITVGLHRHDIPTHWHVNMLPHYQLRPCHLEKREEDESK
jgi:hypothetical protein